jgi:hypothetical protein
MKKIILNLMKIAFVAGLIALYSCGGITEQATDTSPVDEIEAVNEDAETTGEIAELDLSKGKEV